MGQRWRSTCCCLGLVRRGADKQMPREGQQTAVKMSKYQVRDKEPGWTLGLETWRVIKIREYRWS